MEVEEAKLGDVIPTVATDLDQDSSVLPVSLEVLHSYRGDQQKAMRLTTARVVATVDSILRLGSGTECMPSTTRLANFLQTSAVGQHCWKRAAGIQRIPTAERDTCSEQRGSDCNQQTMWPSRSDGRNWFH